MSQIRNNFNIKNTLNKKTATNLKRLPNFFNDYNEIGVLSGLSLSILIHILLAALMCILCFLQPLIFSRLPKPELPKQNIEFILVQKETKPPIKKTKNFSDVNSRAGGKHDPKKRISEPNAPKAASSKPKTPSVAQQPKKPTVQPKQQKIAQQPKQQPQQQVKTPTPQAPKAPSAINKPTVKPSVKPISKPTTTTAPSAPKITQAPKSPFTVPVPTTKVPAGKTYQPSSQGASKSSSSSSSSTLAPKFSASKTGSSTGSTSGSSAGSTGSYASRGGSGSYGNPGPGNPSGAPGVDAIRQPNWGPYMRDLEQRIKRNWTPPKGDSSKRVVIKFTIGRDGRLLSHKIVQSSGLPIADRAALSAIELTAPFRPLPPEHKGSSVDIEFTFDYNVLNSILR